MACQKVFKKIIAMVKHRPIVMILGGIDVSLIK